MMRVLFVEDDESVVHLVEDELQQANIDVEITIARSRDAALVLLETDTFDAFIFDLRIPTQDGALDEQEAHGLAVIQKARLRFPGTPFCILTGRGTPQNISEPLASAPSLDVFGDGLRPLAKYCAKDNYAPFLGWIADLNQQTRLLDQIEVAGTTDALSIHNKRALRIFARRRGGTILHVSALGGGLSAANTLLVKVYDKDDGVTAYVVAKLARLDRIDDEQQRYNGCVTRLAIGGFAHHMDQVIAGCGHGGGLFYRLAEDHPSLFDVLQSDPTLATSVVQSLRNLEAPWRQDTNARAVMVSDVRRSFIDDEHLAGHRPSLAALRQVEVEAKTIQVRELCQHGDLHGDNVLVDSTGRPVLIDFGEVRLAAASLDPVTLELSLAFHPRGRAVSGGWPNAEAARIWPNIDEYVRDCPVGPFVRACREWAFADSSSHYAVFANAYGYALRQLQYTDVDPSIALAVAESASAKILAF